MPDSPAASERGRILGEVGIWFKVVASANSGAPLKVLLLGATVCAEAVTSKRHNASKRRGKEAKAMRNWVGEEDVEDEKVSDRVKRYKEHCLWKEKIVMIFLIRMLR